MIGWSLTALPQATATAYATTIEELRRAITLHRRSEASGPGSTGNNNLIAAVRACPRRIRVAAGTLPQGAILCDLCKAAFEPAPAPPNGDL